MGTEFLRLRRKNAVWRLLRSLMLGLAVALLLGGGLMIFFKLTSTNGQVMLSALIGAAAGLVVAIVRWLMLRRSDLRAAEQMDEEHSLKEKVQTMIAFQGEDSAMLQLQREDTEKALKDVRSYGIRKLSVAVCIIMVVLSAAVLAGGLILPARAETQPPVITEPEYNASAWQLAALEELIVHVQDSNMNQLAKDQTVAELQDLREALNVTMTVSAFKLRVVEVITNVYAYTDRVNSNDDLHDVIAVLGHDVAADLAYVVGAIENHQFGADVENIGFQLGQDFVLPTLGELADDLDTQLSLIESQYVGENDYGTDDGMYNALLGLAEGLHTVAGMIGNATAEEISDSLGQVIYDFKSLAGVAKEQQWATKEECIYVVDTLCSIFAISPNECPPDPDPTYTKKLPEDEFGDQSGGAGTGDMQYAGNEQVYDYKQNEHVPYTGIVTDYYQSMLQAINEGKIPPEVAEFIMKYFSQLYTG